MYLYHVIGTIAVLQLTCCFCSGDDGKPEQPKKPIAETMLSEKKLFEDVKVEEVDAILQNIDRLKNRFLHDVIDSKAMRAKGQDFLEKYIMDVDAKKQDFLDAKKHTLETDAKEQAYWDQEKYTSQNQLVNKDKEKIFKSVLAQTTSWPEGEFGFPQPRQGCPSGFTSGCRTHDCEDWRNRNAFQGTKNLRGAFEHDIRMCYCVKTSSGSSAPWPAGRYCINRVGGSCPGGFVSGFLDWDDESDANDNARSGILPDGIYGEDTKMYYCCRNDGTTSTSINLPTADSFVLYQYRSRGCQSVADMSSTEVIVKFDTDDYWNKDNCTTPVPYNPQCSSENHKIHMCYYTA